MFVIEDEAHDEAHGECKMLESAIAELRRRAEIPWDRPPNLAPCWMTCGHRYEIVEYDAAEPGHEIRRFLVLEISSASVNWSDSLGSTS